MATFLSPAVFVNEIDLSALPAGSSGIIPAFLGTASKGILNKVYSISNAQQYIDTFGNPFPESFLGYAVLAYMEEGNLAYVMRVGVECEDGQPQELSSVCIDTSGNFGHGWGRIPLFSGIDFGRINTRTAGTNGWSFHDASVTFVEFNDAVVDVGTAGPTSASLTFVGSDYVGSTDDSFLLLITGKPTVTGGAPINGATYVIIRASDGATVANGTLTESVTPGTSDNILVVDGVVAQIVMGSAGPYQTLDINDSFRFSVVPNNRNFSVRIDNESPLNVNVHTMPIATYTTAASLAAAINAITGMSSENFLVIDNGDESATLRTKIAGQMIQLWNYAEGTETTVVPNYPAEAFAIEIGQSLYAFDIPRSNLIGTQTGVFNISSSNNVVTIELNDTSITQFTATLPTGLGLPPSVIASAINAAATILGDTLVRSYALTIPGGDQVLVIETVDAHRFGTIKMLADGSHPKTLNFASQVGIQYPYTESYRGFSDSRVELPAGGEVTQQEPLSCEQYAGGDVTKAAQCQIDSDYYGNVVGWFVAPSPGTWVAGYKINISIFKGSNVPAGRYEITLNDANGIVLTRLQNVSFDKRDTVNYIGVLVNPNGLVVDQTSDVGGNEYLRWIDRPSYLNNDVNDPSTFEVRQPAQIYNKSFDGQANGIPTDPIFSTELDRAIIGNPADMTGIYKLANPEMYDITLMITPGFSSGAVITTALSVCTQRGDCFYIVDSPFGLTAQQVVDWHNGLLFTDLRVALDSSYGGLYHPWIKIFDQYNGGNIWVPPCGHIAAVFARTDRVAEMWFAPAGLNRGQFITALDVEVEHPRGDRDLMYGYGNAVNPILKYPQRGIYIWGQRTLQRKNSALDRINVRMLLIAIKKALAGPQGLLNEYLFEQNDRITRQLVKGSIDNYMSDVAARRGVTAWKTICDDSNNTAIRIDRNELWIALLMKPTRAIEFIVLNVGIMRDDQSFVAEEVLAAVGVTTAAVA
jgi:hypothetical protein